MVIHNLFCVIKPFWSKTMSSSERCLPTPPKHTYALKHSIFHIILGHHRSLPQSLSRWRISTLFWPYSTLFNLYMSTRHYFQNNYNHFNMMSGSASQTLSTCNSPVIFIKMQILIQQTQNAFLASSQVMLRLPVHGLLTFWVVRAKANKHCFEVKRTWVHILEGSLTSEVTLGRSLNCSTASLVHL